MHRLIINLSDELKNAGIKVRTIVNGEVNLLTGETEVSSTGATFDFVTPKKMLMEVWRLSYIHNLQLLIRVMKV